MYRPGHDGLALLLYAPLGLVLLGVDRSALAVAGGAVTVGLAPLPDFDLRLPVVSHRGVTHTVGFAHAVDLGVGAGAVGWSAGRGTGAGLAAQ